MTSANLAYSDNVRCAFLAAIVRSFQDQHPGGFLGRTAMQKLVYFANVLGTPIPCSFNIYTYGPYSDAVYFAMDSLQADEVVEDRSPKSDYSNYRLGPNANELLTAYAADVEPHRALIDRVVGALGGYKPRELELIATLHFIAEWHRETRRRAPLKDEVIREFKTVKKDKFPDDEIDSWYEALNQAGLI
jgi:uncharacterized protein YwgA